MKLEELCSLFKENMSILVKTFVFLSAVLVAGNVRLVEANVPAPFRLTNLNIQSVSVNASLFNFMTLSFNGNKEIYFCRGC